MSFLVHRLKKRAAATMGLAADWSLFIGIVLIGGLGSSWYMVEAGSRLTTETVGPWTTWTSAARPDADPYTRAHYARIGVLPLSSEFAQTYVARTDSEGRALHSSCDYAIEGRDIPTHWWSLSVFDSKGRLIPNAAQRYRLHERHDRPQPGRHVHRLACPRRESRQLAPTGGARRLALSFSVVDLGVRAVTKEGEIEERLPVIRRRSC